MSSQLLAKISFPVFVLGKLKPQQLDNITFFLLGKDTKYSDATYRTIIVDDKNLAGQTLAARRLELLTQEVPLFKLKKAIFFIGDLIKLAISGTWFIDSLGFIFEYKKTTTVPLEFKRITKVIQIATGGAIIEVQGIATRFKTLFAPTLEQTHAGILVWNKAFILYGLYDKKYSNTTRRI